MKRFQEWLQMWGRTFQIFGPAQKLWLPFIMALFVEIALVGLVWLAPHPPFSTLLAPPVRYFYSDRVLHYPWHMWFIYYVTKHTHVVASVLAGAFLSGVACEMVRQTHQAKPLSLREALAGKKVRYITVALIWLILWSVGRGALEALLKVIPSGKLAVWHPICFAVLIQWLFVYAIPAAVFEGLSWWKAILRGIKESIRFPLSTLSAVIVFTAPLFLFAFLLPEGRVTQWVIGSTPEIAFLLTGIRLLMWMTVDALLTVSIAHLWCLHRPEGLSAPQATERVPSQWMGRSAKEGTVVA
ncbi:MAG: hypothetical protein NC910_03310 [Candidatus Omnitrophica bacterium]|nr:hypothetical protein [Candidatus Omnitrophota bacterium]